MKKDVTAKDANNAKKELLFKDECYAIQGAVFNVYHEMGCGFLEAVKTLASEHTAQLLNYLKATGLELGLLVNFGSFPKTEIKRIANTDFRDFCAFSGSSRS